MTQNEKDLLIKDLCARLPYGVICADIHADEKFTNKWDIFAIDRTFGNEFLQVCISNCGETYGYKIPIERIKPYLFPLSSMTEEQKKEYNYWKHEVPVCHYAYGDVIEEVELFESPASFDYLIENHFDYYGLIPLGLAEDATGKNIY